LAKDYLKLNRTLTIRLVCKTLNLARSSYYAAKKAKKRKDRLDNQVYQQIEKVWKTFPGWGYRKLASRLKVNGKRILRILRKYQAISPKRKKPGKPRGGGKYLNLLKKIARDLIACPEKQKRGNWILKNGTSKGKKSKHVWLIEPVRPYQLWAGDWKELKVPLLGVTIYIFFIIDCYTRKAMGWKVSLVKDGKAALAASRMAIARAEKDPLFDPKSLIMHTDQGSAYKDEEYGKYWKKLGVHPSMADRGKPYQNPYIEAFFSILVRFWLKQHELLTIAEIKQSLKKFFKLYNNEWLHGEIGFITPNQRLEQYRSYLKN